MTSRRITVEIDTRTLHRLMAERQLAAAEFRCMEARDRQSVKRWCLQLLSHRLR